MAKGKDDHGRPYVPKNKEDFVNYREMEKKLQGYPRSKESNDYEK